MKAFFHFFASIWLPCAVLPAVSGAESGSGLRGLQVNSTIIGGSQQTSLIPYFVHFGNGACGGSLITGDMVLTAAHCCQGFLGQGEDFPTSVRIGPLLSSDGLSVNVDTNSSVIHPSFVYFLPRLGHDVCLLKLATTVNTGTYPPVSLNSDCCKPCDGDTVKIYGYGDAYDNGTNPNFLKTLDTTYRCGPSTDNVIRIDGGPSSGACFGDSGGPGVIGNVQYGIASFTSGGCASGTPDGYSRVSADYNWIREQVCNRASDKAPFDCSAGGSCASAARAVRSFIMSGARGTFKTMSSFMGFRAKYEWDEDDWFYPIKYPDQA